jgi:hypothetical protein
MPFGSVTLVPGVNVERTPMLLRAGISQSSFIRFRDSLVQKYGGWQKFYPFSIAGVPRDLHVWEDLNRNTHLSIGTTTQLGVITNNVLQNVSPQTLTSDFIPNISSTINTPTIDIVDPNISNVTVFDSVFFNVPVSVGGLILDGLYPITEITGTHAYQIVASKNATATETNPTATNNTTAAGNATLHFASTPSWVVKGMVIANLTTPTSIPVNTTVSSVTGSTVVMSNNAAGAGVGSGDSIVFSSIPVFTTISGGALVNVTFIDHGLSVGSVVVFAITTTGNGVSIVDAYDVVTVTDGDNFSINVSTQATLSGSFAMNSGDAELVYSIALGPPAIGAGYGLGTYGTGGYGTGTTTSAQTGTDITARDWTSDNWGNLLVACPRGGGIYYWDPTGGFINAQIVSSGPPFNNGIFISMAEQILVSLGSSVHRDIGYQKQPLLVQWCDVGNFFQWQATASTQAGNFPIPIGSSIQGGFAVSNQNLIWTDQDLWAMSYIGPPDVFGFNKIGAGMGLVSFHAMQQLRGSVYWMSPTNFCNYTSGGANVIPCPVWDQVFQNINNDHLNNVRAMPNTPYNEVGWLYPSAASVSGECDSYVKFNITEPGAPWDYGMLQRSAWIDQNILYPPIGATPTGVIYQHETTPDADGNPLAASFTTGFFYLAEGEEFVFVDQVIPDFKYETVSGTSSAQIQLTFNVVNYPWDKPTSYGPYTVTNQTEYISVRFRGRLMSITVQSSDSGSWWRLGKILFRYSTAGRR